MPTACYKYVYEIPGRCFHHPPPIYTRFQRNTNNYTLLRREYSEMPTPFSTHVNEISAGLTKLYLCCTGRWYERHEARNADQSDPPVLTQVLVRLPVCLWRQTHGRRGSVSKARNHGTYDIFYLPERETTISTIVVWLTFIVSSPQ